MLTLSNFFDHRACRVPASLKPKTHKPEPRCRADGACGAPITFSAVAKAAGSGLAASPIVSAPITPAKQPCVARHLNREIHCAKQ